MEWGSGGWPPPTLPLAPPGASDLPAVRPIAGAPAPPRRLTRSGGLGSLAAASFVLSGLGFGFAVWPPLAYPLAWVLGGVAFVLALVSFALSLAVPAMSRLPGVVALLMAGISITAGAVGPTLGANVAPGIDISPADVKSELQSLEGTQQDIARVRREVPRLERIESDLNEIKRRLAAEQTGRKR